MRREIGTDAEQQRPPEDGALADDLDLSSLAPLDAEQIYQLIDMLTQPAAGGTFRARIAALFSNRRNDRFWEHVAFRVNSGCPNSVPRTASELEKLARLIPRGTRSSVFLKYSLWVQLFPDRWWTFMNYGYHGIEFAEHPLNLEGPEQTWRYSTQLYHHLATLADLGGRDVLEIGCGRGGGAAYVARALKPRSLTAVDATRSNVNFCRGAHRVPRLRFGHARAEALPFPDASFDAVMNVESCNYYSPFSDFVREVHRVLRPGGSFLIAFYDPPAKAYRRRAQIVRAGLAPVREEDISRNVRTALSLFRSEDMRRALETHVTVRPMHLYLQLLDEIYTVPSLTSGAASYYCFAFEKER